MMIFFGGKTPYKFLNVSGSWRFLFYTDISISLKEYIFLMLSRMSSNYIITYIWVFFEPIWRSNILLYGYNTKNI